MTRARRPRRSSRSAETPESAPPAVEPVEALIPPAVPVPVPPAEPPAAPRPRRAVFVDVENTSSKADLTRVLDELNVEREEHAAEIMAIGNWRVVGQDLARALAERGAQLVHSAPVTRVSDWSDLWIAVSAGIWLGRARPGDVIEIVSHDRAFDAVGDAAARLGVVFRRITYRAAGGGRRAPAIRRAAEPEPKRAAPAAEERHSAAVDQIQSTIAALTKGDPAAGVTLDALTLALKAAGFQRPPNSPRLVSRLRRMKDVEVGRDGRIRLVHPPAADEAATPDAATSASGRRRRRSRRGGRRHRRTPAESAS